MDFFAHLLWNYIFFNKYKKLKLSLAFAAMPDLFSFGILLVVGLFTGFRWAHPADQTVIPSWVPVFYSLTHSLVIIAAVFLVVYLIFRTIPVYLLAWPIHVVIDIFTHSLKFYPTPFLWPISNFHFPGISWGTLWFMIVNYVLIVSCIVYINRKKIKKLFKKI